MAVNRYFKSFFIMILGVGSPSLIKDFEWVPLAHAVTIDSSKAVTEQEIEEFLSFYKSLSEFKVDFKQEKKIKDMNIPILSKGYLRVVKPETIYWTITEPAALSVTLNSESIQIKSGSGPNQVMQTFKRSDMGQGKETRSLSALSSWMQMDTAKLAKEYSVTHVSEREFLFSPKDKEASPFKEMKVQLSGKTKGVKKDQPHIEKLTLFESSGDQLLIYFSKPQIIRTSSQSHY